MRKLWLAIWLCLVPLSSFANNTDTDELAPYKKMSGLSGTISSVGSDTLATLMLLWAQEFQHIYPNVHMQVQASGSSTAPTALTEATSQFGPMSRPMKAKEREAFERQYGYPPVQLKIAIDAIGIFVHKDNPIEGLNFTQVDAIFSSTLKCGATQSLNTWQQLGINTDWAKLGFQLFGRNSVSGTYGYFKQHALCDGDFKRQVNEQLGSASVVQSVASSINSIGYSGVGYQVSKARLLPIAKEGRDYVAPTRANILNGDYPLARYLYVYVNKNPLKPLPQPQAEFLKFIYSKQGQIGVEKDGYVPLSQALASAQLRKVGL
ncbi:PstS family phosphate ABC transporter substrate-binding protein [Vibrio gangliei]|uniref:PstS family phosphate ABC transporter substrate-binding protein n=1 Tax=Vibrio gangliei TaxID=2077090 RepID=UPI000D01360B|nr:phosphate ABC transporter substrate-binding protein PstS family protein [Vibrio gangliei]